MASRVSFIPCSTSFEVGSSKITFEPSSAENFAIGLDKPLNVPPRRYWLVWDPATLLTEPKTVFQPASCNAFSMDLLSRSPMEVSERKLAPVFVRNSPMAAFLLPPPGMSEMPKVVRPVMTAEPTFSCSAYFAVPDVKALNPLAKAPAHGPPNTVIPITRASPITPWVNCAAASPDSSLSIRRA